MTVPQPEEGEQPDALPPEIQRQQRIISAQVEASSTFSGPLPPPDILIKYNEAIPDAAERILAMAERQANHRMELERQVVNADIGRSRLGLGAGFIVALGGLAASYFLIDGGNTAAGLTVASIDIVSLVSVFVFGTVSSRQERIERAKMMSGQSS